jgi:tetratricopeptide (TPR) repeat protein
MPLHGALLALCLAGCGAAPPPSALPVASSGEGARQAPRRFVPPFAYEAYVRGELALAAGNPREAALQLEMATAAPDEDAYLLTRLAEAQLQNGEAELARDTLAAAQRLQPCAESVWLTRGRWAERERKLDVAADAYRTALDCVPDSQAAAIALSRVLRSQGAIAESLTLLGRGVALPRTAALRLSLSQQLAQGDTAELRFALESWLAVGGVDQSLLEEAAQQAIARNLPLLALRLEELAPERLAPDVRAALRRLTLDREAMRALLAQHHEGALGGALRAAGHALWARDYERAELYASLAGTGASDALRALKAEALAGAGEPEQALETLRGVEDLALRRELAGKLLARSGMGALGAELARR